MFFFFKQKTAYEMRISDWSSDVCSSDLRRTRKPASASCHAASEPARPPPMMWMSCVMSLSVDLCSMARALRWYGVGLKRHCERSEAIQSGLRLDRKSDGSGKRESVLVDLGWRRIFKKKLQIHTRL